MATRAQEDLTAPDGPDDWVSLFLNDVGEHLIDSEEAETLTRPASGSASEQSSFDQARPAGSSNSLRGPVAPAASGLAQNSGIDELCLPSLDDLLAGSSEYDPDGLFSGFNSLNNTGVNAQSGNNLVGLQCQCTGAHSCQPDPQSSSDNEHSSTAPQVLSAFPSDMHVTQQHHDTGAIQGRPAAPSSVPPFSSQPAAHTQPDMPSLAGLTAAQVATAIGFTGQQQHTQQAAAAPPTQLPATSSPGKPQARGHRKRTRDLDNSSSIPTTAVPMPSSSQAEHSAAAPVGTRSGSPDVSSNNDAASSGQEQRQQSSSQDSAQPDEELKRQARMQRNRESAHQSRQRKRMQASEVEQRCEQLKQHNSQLNELVGRLTAENIGLKQQLVGICQQTGTPLPPPPACAVMPPFGFNQMGMPMMPTPKVPIHRMPAVRPAPAYQFPACEQLHTQQPSQQAVGQPGSHHPPSSIKPQPAQPQRARKRAKQAAGASTVLLALFSFVVLMGPLGPLQGFTPSSPQQHVMHSSDAGAANDGLHSSGRVLMSLPSAAEHMPARLNDTQLQLLRDNRLPKNGVVSLMEGSGENDVALPGHRHAEMRLHQQGWWSQGPDDAPYDSPKSIMLRPSDKAAEQQALEGLRDLAPYALYHSYWDQGMTPAHLPIIQSSWQQALPGGVDPDGSRSLAGFVGPSMCQQVFQSAATEDSSPMQATQRAQRHLAAGTSMRGSGSIPLPPVQGYEQDMDKHPQKKARKTTIGCGEDDPGVVVSVMLPSKTEGSDTEYTSLDQLYVVVLTPGVKYSTYSCLLPKPILV